MILVQNDRVIFRGSEMECIDYLDFRLDEYGSVYLRNYKDTISYRLDDWTIDEIKKDFLKCRFKTIIERSNIEVYY
jgi:hypothetical protein